MKKEGLYMAEETINQEIEAFIKQNPIALFMKGTAQQPMCGFSSQVVQILNQYDVVYEAKNVLDDWNLREGIKAFSSWPTIPQLYVRGQFIGGCDILMELHRKGELEAILCN